MPCDASVVQEAYYWSYAQHPDLSYYDHPPDAWPRLIWLGTAVLGDGALGVRLGTLLWAFRHHAGGARVAAGLGGARNERARLGWIVFSGGVPILMMTRFLGETRTPSILVADDARALAGARRPAPLVVARRRDRRLRAAEHSGSIPRRQRIDRPSRRPEVAQPIVAARTIGSLLRSRCWSSCRS